MRKTPGHIIFTPRPNPAILVFSSLLKLFSSINLASCQDREKERNIITICHISEFHPDVQTILFLKDPVIFRGKEICQQENHFCVCLGKGEVAVMASKLGNFPSYPERKKPSLAGKWRHIFPILPHGAQKSYRTLICQTHTRPDLLALSLQGT